MLIITSPAYSAQVYSSNALTVEIPLKKIALINGADLRVYPTHDDHILDETIGITLGPIAGIIGYPLSVLYQENCTWVIDEYTTALTLDVPEIFLGDTKFGPLFWNIPYRSLLEFDAGNFNLIYDPYLDLNRIQRSEQPPQPHWSPNTNYDTTGDLYWEDMGKFIWNYFMKNNDF